MKRKRHNPEEIIRKLRQADTEYADVKLSPYAGADRAFHEAAELERRQLFPITLATAGSHLWPQRHSSRPELLELLIQKGIVKPAAIELDAPRRRR